MAKELIQKRIAGRVAKEIHDGDVVNLGVGMPTLVPGFLPSDMKVYFQSENGIIGTAPTPEPEDAEPGYIVNAGGLPSMVSRGGSYIDSCTSFGMIRGGHVDCTILGALQVDQEGNLSNWIIPGKMIPGMGGAMDLAVGAKKVIIAMEHTAKGNLRILKKCTLPYTAKHCVNMIVTNMCVIEVTDHGLVLKEYHPEFTLQQIHDLTEADIDTSQAVEHDY